MQTPPASRQEQILTLLLNADAGLSIDEMAEKLGISRNAVKQHLDGLEKQQLIKEAALTNTGGRPARSYVLTEQGINYFPKQYAWFCNLLLEELAEQMEPAALEDMMWHLGSKLAATLQPQFAGKTLQERLVALIGLMQKLGYHAEIDSTAEPETLSIKAVNCVYHDVAKKYPALCQFDRALLAALLDRPVEQTSCIAKQDCACRFRCRQVGG